MKCDWSWDLLCPFSQESFDIDLPASFPSAVVDISINEWSHEKANTELPIKGYV